MLFHEDFEPWCGQVTSAIRGDPIWKLPAYRMALFLQVVAREDVTRFERHRHTRLFANQLWRAVASIGANIAEGYGRMSGRERARFYEYALGSSREARTWYFSGETVLGSPLTADRVECLGRITRILLAVIPRERVRDLR
jgi:four helix bundle protein